MCKNKRFFRILATALTLALLFLAIPASPAMAAYAVNVENYNTESDYYGEPIGEIGDALHVWGGVSTGTSIDIYFSSQSTGVGIGKDIDTEVTAYEILSEGVPITILDTFNSTMGISVPSKLTNETTTTADDEPVHGGTYYIYLTLADDTSIRASTTFTVVGAAKVEMDENSGPVGTEVEITGEDFVPDENIILEYDGDVLDDDYILEGDPEADGDGEFSVIITIPESTYGEHTITVIGEDSEVEFDLTFSVEPQIIIDPIHGGAGDEVTVTGTGFDYRNGVDFYFGGIPITDVVWVVESLGRTNSNGTFIVILTIFDNAFPGSYVILAEDEDDNDIFDNSFYTVWSTTTPTPTITITTTITATTTTTPTPTTPTTITVTSTSEPTTVTPPPTTKTVTATTGQTTITATTTTTPTPLTTTIHTVGDSQVNIWLPIASAFGAIILMLIGFIVYIMRTRGL